ncbi:PAS domain-containing protein [Dongia soli]|uniref:histidine kinase n=1 Tax=Dongia soli TaxID=600628 RepID=A0ABU5EHH5_9PROT|nr:PAS domain-containing protein [Dongia soli]MDY0885762.1 PAS domain S-box protein [Dongia soli]
MGSGQVLLTQYIHSWLETTPATSSSEADCRILVIASDENLLEIIQDCLAQRHVREIRHVATLAEAAQIGIDGALWDLVLISCPDGRDFQSVRGLRHEIGLSRAAIVALVPSAEDLRHAIDAGADDALSPPLNRDTLDLHIAHALEHRGLRNAVDQYWISTVQEHDADLARFVYDAAPEALMLLDSTGIIQAANPAAEELLRCEATLLTGSPIGAFMNGIAPNANEEPRIDRLLTQLNRPNGKPVETQLHRLDGKAIRVEVVGRAVTRLGQPALAISLRDMSGRAPAPASADKAADGWDHHAAMLRLLAQLSDELLAPLDEIVHCAEVIRQEALGPLGVPLYHSYAADIQESSRTLLKLVGRIMDMTKDGENGAAVPVTDAG